MLRTFLTLIAATLVASPLLADNKKDEKKAEKIDPAKLVGEWKEKERGPSPLSPLGIDVQIVIEYEKGGGVKVKLAQPDYLSGGWVGTVGTYKITGSTLEQAVTQLDEKGKPLDGLKPTTESREIVKLTDTELHLKEGKEETVWIRLTADDKDTTVDTAKLVGRWKSTVAASDGEEEVVEVNEFTKDGKLISHLAPTNDMSKVKQKEEFTYKVKDGKVEITAKNMEGKTEIVLVYELVRLTDAKLVIRNTTPIPGLSDEVEALPKWYVVGNERVKEEK